MENLYARAVFFVENTERALQFYVQQLGFAEDWAHQEEGTSPPRAFEPTEGD